MKKNYIIYLQYAALIVFILFSVIFISDIAISDSEDLSYCMVYDNGWTLSTDSYSVQYDSLPSSISSNNSNKICLTNTVSQSKGGEYIGFFAFQQQITVYINDAEVYNFVPSETLNSRTPGNKWIFVKLPEDNDTYKISIQISECYYTGRIHIPTIYYGSESGILLNYLKHESPQLLVSAIMILFGIIVGVFCIMYKRRTLSERSISWLALFAIFKGLWTFTETNVYSFFFGHLVLINQISYMTLKLATMAFLQFIYFYFHRCENKFIKILIWVSAFDFWLSAVLQYAFGIDFAQTVFITHIILLTAGIYTCTYSIRLIPKGSSSQRIFSLKNPNLTHTCCSLAIVTTSFIDIIRYYTVHTPDMALFSRWGDIICLAILSNSLFSNFISLLRTGHQAELIKEAAFTDPLTKLSNRSTFEQDMSNEDQKHLAHSGIVMIDLNNLKHFNDVHGHGMGDYYIIIASEIISDAFSNYGTVYRIGGDEFCAITNGLSNEAFVEVRNYIENYMASLKMPSSDLHMEISAGYAEFDSSLDHTLRDTMKRADELMYQRKMELKKHSD
jgi:diguanylate cyclase (GGDEF)-like protein